MRRMTRTHGYALKIVSFQDMIYICKSYLVYFLSLFYYTPQFIIYYNCYYIMYYVAPFRR